uniref:NADH dehydrogenase subunit 2 n=1 Tax=Pheidole smythiesii TaxID=297326 RepID=UPI002579CF97|nr:NADH dehydrogenase subunit 2 [Pheidole smythiesii]WGV34061.1 NADH dehydrogenase subunit 2 [Pheidole smythiesii]
MIMFLNYFIIPNIFLLSFSSLFFTDFIMIWLILEINNFMFICIMNLSMNNKKMIFFYFMIQIMASFIIIFSIIFNNILFKNNFIIYLMIMALMMKLSIPPFHSWLPLIAKFLPWNLLLLLLTLQKIIPFYMLSLINLNTIILYLIIIICSILPPYIMLNMTNFKMLMSYSSINQSSWMIMLIYMKNIIWFKYFMFYSMISLSLFFIINIFKTFISFNYAQASFKFNLLFIIFMFNMSGLPPFSFFYMKWYSLFTFIMSSNMLIILILMMLSSLIMLYIYINMMINSFFIYKMKSKMITINLIIFNKLALTLFIALFFSSIILIM